jgi:hypothetical protein
VYEVGSRAEAIQLARSFLDRGQYNWFRGQTSNAHSVVPVLLRPTTNEERANQRLDYFFSWIGQTPGLEKIAADEMATLAVAQHYAIPTHLVDFTVDPDVAGFFSYDSPRVIPKDSEAVIVCLNTDDLLRVALPASMPKPECLTIDVSDLWRLQAQHGVFLVCPYSHFEQTVYGFDRIVFPYGEPESVDRTMFYPARKSQLEIALDHYFAEERLADVRSQLEQRFSPVMLSARSQFTSASYWSSAIDEQIGQHASWTLDAIAPWVLLPGERFGHWNGAAIRIDIGELALHRSELSPTARKSIFDQVLAQVGGVRGEPAVWELNSTILSTEGDPVIAPVLSSALEALWDGLRTLPLRNEQIASAAANCIALWAIAEVYPSGILGVSDGQVAQVLGEHRYVELGGAGGSSRSYVSKKGLVNALRPDISTFIVPEFRDPFNKDPSVIVEWAWKVDYLYDFQAFANIVATEMVPYQVLFRRDDPVFYSPARIERIGF